MDCGSVKTTEKLKVLTHILKYCITTNVYDIDVDIKPNLVSSIDVVECSD